MTTITTRPGNPEAIVPYGYLVITDEVGESEEPISDRAMTAIEEHFDRLRGLHETVSREIARTGWTITPEHGLGRMLAEITAMLGVGPWDSPTPKEEVEEVEELLVHAVLTDGGHHKQWFLEEIAKRIGVVLPPHERGIAP